MATTHQVALVIHEALRSTSQALGPSLPEVLAQPSEAPPRFPRRCPPSLPRPHPANELELASQVEPTLLRGRFRHTGSAMPRVRAGFLNPSRVLLGEHFHGPAR